MEKIGVPDKIQLHQKTDDVLYSNLLKATFKIRRMQSVIDKLENQLWHEKVENKGHLVEIKKLHTHIKNLGAEPANVQASKKF